MQVAVLVSGAAELGAAQSVGHAVVWSARLGMPRPRGETLGTLQNPGGVKGMGSIAVDKLDGLVRDYDVGGERSERSSKRQQEHRISSIRRQG